MNKNNQIENNIEIERIRDISFELREDLSKSSEHSVKFIIGHKIGFNTELNFANLTLEIKYFYLDFPDAHIFRIEVENIFKIKDLNKYIIPKDVIKDVDMNVPSEILISIVGLSISHTRALLSKNLSGSLFQYIHLPIINSLSLAKSIFGENVILNNLKYQ